MITIYRVCILKARGIRIPTRKYDGPSSFIPNKKVSLDFYRLVHESPIRAKACRRCVA